MRLQFRKDSLFNKAYSDSFPNPIYWGRNYEELSRETNIRLRGCKPRGEREWSGTGNVLLEIIGQGYKILYLLC